MSKALGALVARHVQLSSFTRSTLINLRGTSTRVRSHAQGFRPLSVASGAWEGDARKVNVYAGKVICIKIALYIVEYFLAQKSV